MKYLASSVIFLTRQDWSEGNGQLYQYKQYQHIHVDFFNIIQLVLDTEWIISDDEAHNVVLVEMFADHLKTVEVTFTELFFSNPSMYIEVDTCIELGRRVIFTSLNF